jgi:hypothetical protein
MPLSAKVLVHMARLRRRIADQLKAGASLSSPKVVELSRRLDELVLQSYRAN